MDLKFVLHVYSHFNLFSIKLTGFRHWELCIHFVLTITGIAYLVALPTRNALQNCLIDLQLVIVCCTKII